MQRMLLSANTEGVSCADCEALQHPAVIASDWIGFICLFGSSAVLVTKLMSFKGPDQDDLYYMGSDSEPTPSAVGARPTYTRLTTVLRPGVIHG